MTFKEKKNKKISLPLGRKIRILLTVFLCLFIQYFIISYYYTSKKQELVNKAQKFSENIIYVINNSLQPSITSSQIIKNLYLEYGQDYYRLFDRISKRFADDDIAIGSLYLAPNGIIELAYPDSVTNSTIGFNMLEDPIQKDKAQYAIDTRRITICGPYNLVEGGTGLIIRNPIFVDGKFDAFSIVVVDLDLFLGRFNKYFDENNFDYDFGLWKDFDSNIVLGPDNYFYKTTETDFSKEVDVAFPVLNDIWHISVQPKGGWNITNKLLHNIFISILLILIILSIVIYYQYWAEEKIYSLEHDVLTGLYTRSAVHRRVRKIFKEQPDVDYDVMVVDIKNFKMINGIHGTQKCDELLCYLAEVISNDMPDSICGRYGGDIFILYYPTYLNRGKEYFFNKVKETIANAPIKNISLKYGYYGKVDKKIPVNMISDRALMAAKSILNNYDYIIANYEGELSRAHEKQQLYESNFETALRGNDFKIWYQPKFDVKTGKLYGAEALVRWIKKDGTVIPPFDFIRIFEEDGLIVHLDEFVFRNVCQNIKYWYDRKKHLVPISINLSRTTLHHEGIVQKYKNIIDEIGIPIDTISLEITESATYSDAKLIHLAKELQEAGFILDMDDFGTGSSSLASLNMLPFNDIKIDKSLVDFIGKSDGNELLRHIIELAHFKNMKVIAEGVETKEQVDFLKSLDCDVIQGYFYSKPLNHDDWIAKIIECEKQNNVL